MSFYAKFYGTEKEPVRTQDLNALTGCALAWWYNREDQENKEEVKATEVLEAAAKETIFQALREGIWAQDLCEKMFRDAYRRIAAKRLVDWEHKNPKQEGRLFLDLLKNFLVEARRTVASVVALDAPFSVTLGGGPLCG